MNPERSERIEIPVLPLRDVVVYPHMVIPLFVGREKSIRCLEAAMDHDKKIMLVAQKEASTDEPFLIHQESNVIVRAFRDYLRQDIVLLS